MMKVIVITLCLMFFLCYADAKGLILPHGISQGLSTLATLTPPSANYCKGCIATVEENHNHDLEKIIRDVEKLQEMKTWFCHEHTFACIGVSTEKREKKEMTDEELLAHIVEVSGPMRTPNPVRATDEL